MAANPTPAMVDLQLSAGNGRPTQQNFTASGPDIPLDLGPDHVLRRMSGGAATVTLRELEVAVTAAVFVDREALGSTRLQLVAWSLPTIAAVFRSALVLGMETESRGSMRAALHYFVAFVRDQRRAHPVEFTFSDATAFQPLPAAPANSLTQETAWVSEVLVQSGVDAGNDAVVLAALINLLPERYTAAGRLKDDFVDSVSELYAEAVSQQPDIIHKRPARQASVVVGTMRSRVPEARFLIYSPPARTFDEAQLYRFKPEDAVQIRFKDAWTLSYTSISQLLTSSCSSSDAWALVSMMVEEKPTYETLSALNSKIEGLLGIIDSDPELKVGVGSIEMRAKAMHKILQHKPSTYGESAGGAMPTDPARDTALLTSRSSTKELLDELHKDDVVPLIKHRIINTMLTLESMVGWQYLAGKPPALAHFKTYSSCKAESAIVQAFKRHLCVDAKGDRQTGWYAILDQDGKCPLAMKMVKAEWASNGALAFNPWLEVVGPLVRKFLGDHAVAPSLDVLAKANPAAMFTHAFMLKYGKEHIVRLFGFIGYGGAEDKSVAAVMRTLERYTERLDLVPDSVPNYAGQPYDFAGAKNSCKIGLQDAAVCAFVEFAGRIKGALDSPAINAVRPTPFAEEGCGFQDALVDIEELLQQMEGDVKRYLKLSRATEAAAARAGAAAAQEAAAGSKSSAGSSVGPSVSQAGSMMGALAVAPLTAHSLAALQQQTRLPSEFSMQGPPQGGGGFPARGSMVNSLQYDSGGVWVTTAHGPRWCSAKGPRPLTLEGLCPASLLPNSVDRNAYCTGGSNCAHRLPRNFQRVLSTKVLDPATLIVKPSANGGGARGDGRGGGADKRGNGGDGDASKDKDIGQKAKKYHKKRPKAKDTGDA